MLIISHRGNLKGPDPKRENRIEAIEECLLQGFCVEVDLNLCEDGWKLGHGVENMLPVDLGRIDRPFVFVHLKPPCVVIPDLNHADLFAIEEDPFVFTASGLVWSRFTFNFGFGTGKIIVCAPELDGVEHSFFDFVKTCLKEQVYGICTDFPEEARSITRNLTQ